MAFPTSAQSPYARQPFRRTRQSSYVIRRNRAPAPSPYGQSSSPRIQNSSTFALSTQSSSVQSVYGVGSVQPRNLFGPTGVTGLVSTVSSQHPPTSGLAPSIGAPSQLSPVAPLITSLPPLASNTSFGLISTTMVQPPPPPPMGSASSIRTLSYFPAPMFPSPPPPFTLNPMDPSYQLSAIVDGFKQDPSNPRFKFSRLFLGLTTPNERVKPVHVPDRDRETAMNSIQDFNTSQKENLWPKMTMGIDGLSSRIKEQDAFLSEYDSHLSSLESNLKQLQDVFQFSLQPKVENCQVKERLIRKRMLAIIHKLEMLSLPKHSVSLTETELKILQVLENAQKVLKLENENIIQRTEDAVYQVNLLSSFVKQKASDTVQVNPELDRVLDELTKSIIVQQQSVLTLLNQIKRDFKDLDVITGASGRH